MSAAAPRILVLGAGSIGARHARELLAAGAEVDLMDLLPERATAIDGATPRPLDLTRLDGYQGIVVATPTALHLEHATAALQTGARVLVEKPLATTGADAAQLADLGGARLCVAYNLRFHEPVCRTIGAIHDGTIGRLSSLRLWFGSWLPDWRPGTPYQTSYSAQRAQGGGVLLDAIHELDLLGWALRGAELQVVGAVVDRLGPLEIDVEDSVLAVLRTRERGVAVDLSLDYLARRYRRGIEATGDVATVRLDWARNVIEVEDADRCTVEPADAPVDRSYALQDQAFAAWAAGGPALPVDGHTGAASVVLADAIRAAAT